LREFRIEGIKTTIPADIAILEHADFAAAEHSTKWVEDRLDLSTVGVEPTQSVTTDGEAPEAKIKRDVDVEVNGKRFAVSVWIPESAVGAVVATGGGGRVARPKRSSGGASAAAAGSGSVTVPMQGTIVKLLVEEGQTVEIGQTICVLEAMKMENNITAEIAGTIKEIKVAPGDSVGSGDVVAVIE